jgi:hypothetical protein
MINEKDFVVWDYKGKADITLGEQKVSKLPKVLLTLLLLFITVIGLGGYIYRFQIYDYITKPQIWLTTESIELEVGSTFNPKDFIYKIPEQDRYLLVYPTAANVDMNTLGEYKVEYKLTDSLETRTTELIIKVVDTTPPVLTLEKEVESIYREDGYNEERIKNNIKEYYDNYDKELQVHYPTEVDLSKDKAIIEYKVIDSSGNETIKTLTLIIASKPKPSTPSSTGSSGGSSSGGSSSSGGTTTPTKCTVNNFTVKLTSDGNIPSNIGQLAAQNVKPGSNCVMTVTDAQFPQPAVPGSKIYYYWHCPIHGTMVQVITLVE